MPVGRQYELDMQRDLRGYVDSDTIHVALPDRSGNASGSYYDLEVINCAGSCEPANTADSPNLQECPQGLAAFVELKKRAGERGYRTTVMEGGHEGENGIQELTRLVEGAPVWGQTFLALKFRNCELAVFEAFSLRQHLTDDTYVDEKARTFGARLTDGGNISMRKPELDEWPSARDGVSDHEKLLQQTGFMI